MLQIVGSSGVDGRDLPCREIRDLFCSNSVTEAS
jgi:hypothetical protein